MANQVTIQLPRPKAPIDQGATDQQTYVFPVHQPLPHWKLQAARAMAAQVPAPVVLHYAASVVPEQTYVFPLSQPQFRAYVRITSAPIVRPIDGAVAEALGISAIFGAMTNAWPLTYAANTDALPGMLGATTNAV